MGSAATPDDSEPKRRRFQYASPKLLIVVTLVGCGFGFCVTVKVKVEQGRRQQAAVKAIQKLGGCVSYDYEHNSRGDSMPDAKEPGPDWLHALLGDDFFRNVHDATFAFAQSPSSITDANAELLKDFTRLKELNLDFTQVSDAGLEQLMGLTQLEHLSLDGTRVTDAGLGHLKAFTQLKYLYLAKTQVTDAGLKHLIGLTQLQWLDLEKTGVTDAGVNQVHRALPNCQIFR